MNTPYVPRIRDSLSKKEIIPFIGVYDVFSASIAARYFNGLFLSGYSFAASYYGLPDIGFITWTDMRNFVERVRAILPRHQLLVDIDDGYGDPEIAAHVASRMESAGASGIVLEDQKRPRKCGHMDGKQLLELDEYLVKLKKVLNVRKEMFVIARTDATEEHEIIKRIKEFQETGADAVLVEAIRDIGFIKKLKKITNKPIMINKIAGGKSPDWSLNELKNAGVTFVNYSTPCLFAAQGGVEEAMIHLKNSDGVLGDGNSGRVDLSQCSSITDENLKKGSTA